MKVMLERRLNAPLTSSVGRLFDALAGIIGLQLRSSFAAQAAMALEFALGEIDTDQAYPLPLVHSGSAKAPWTP